MNLAQQSRLLGPIAEVVPVSSVTGNSVLSQKRAARLRCLVESGSWRLLPALDGVDYGTDPRADADLILIPGDPEPSAIGGLLGQTHTPAPVIISQSQTLGSRADLVLADWSASSLSAAILPHARYCTCFGAPSLACGPGAQWPLRSGIGLHSRLSACPDIAA